MSCLHLSLPSQGKHMCLGVFIIPKVTIDDQRFVRYVIHASLKHSTFTVLICLQYTDPAEF